MTVQSLAEAIAVNPKTVERWITQGKVPYRRHQYATAAVLKVDVTTLWEDGPDRRQRDGPDQSRDSDRLPAPAHRAVGDCGGSFYGRAERNLDVLVYSGLFLSEDPPFHDLVKAKVEAGAQVRIPPGDPDCAAVRQRGIDEGHQIMDGKIRNALLLYRPLMRSHPGIGFRLHDSDALQLHLPCR
ncbi:XRE family transcriptional regulator [Streptomyces tricolor]|nr:XRE family transcriptional regulator [Streptomyces tricolor]